MKKMASAACMMIVCSSIFAGYVPDSIVEENIDTFLATPASGAETTIPVIILRYLPTIDGLNLDVSKASDFWNLGEITLAQLKRNIDAYNIRGKFMLEEGSRFRGYKDVSAKPYLGYKVIKSWTIYSQIPISGVFKAGNDVPYPDFFRIAEDFNFKHYIEELGVKEIWIWFGQPAMPDWPSYDPRIHKKENFVEFIESNMASPTTGDISNSYRQNDLPIYSNSYVLYCYNFRRTQAEMIHNHGHQLESIYKYVAERQDGTYNLFVKDFSGWGANYSSAPIGRAGDTHHPPNTTKDYDYYNPTLVSSDIEDWRPDASGAKTLVNMDTWGEINYPWPATDVSLEQKVESQWYIYWMQNMPGYQNMIPYRAKTTMTNWWEFTADWDGVIKAGKGLYGSPTPFYIVNITKIGTGNGTVSGGGSYTAGAQVNLTATPNSGSAFAGWSPSPCATTFAMPANDLTCTATFTGGTAVTTTAVEFYHAGKDHYFNTANKDDIAFLEANPQSGWFKTGYTFKVYPLDSTPSGTFPVARYYGALQRSGVYKPDSHFYTGLAGEREILDKGYQQACPQGQGSCTGEAWFYEKDEYRVYLPNGSSCPSGSRPLYRFYNEGYPTKDSNHRYTIDTGVAADMLAKGWRDEGVKMCVPN